MRLSPHAAGRAAGGGLRVFRAGVRAAVGDDAAGDGAGDGVFFLLQEAEACGLGVCEEGAEDVCGEGCAG